MNNIVSDNGYTVEINEKQKLLLITLNSECKNIASNQLQEQLNIFNDIISEHKPKRILFNVHKCDFFVDPDNYRWYERTLFSIIKPDNNPKIAIVVPQNLFVHASFEAARVSLENQEKKIQYFIDDEKANHWLVN